jgi:methylmalonyl-CoA mutase
MSVSMTMNGAVLPILALYVVAAEEQGVAPEQLTGTIQNDILKEFMVRNTYIYPPEPSMRIISDIFAFTSAEDAEVQLDLHLRLPHAGGRGDPDLELAYTLADGVEYIRAGQGRRPRRRRLRAAPVVLLGHRHELLHGGRQDARRPPALGEAGQGAVRPIRQESLSLRTHSQTSGWSLTAQDVFNNVVRTCIEAMAATQGHTQSLHTNALDEAIALPTDFSARIARNTQLFCSRSPAPRGSSTRGAARLRRAPHPRPRPAGVVAHRGGRGRRRHGQGDRGRHPEDAHRGGRRPHPGAHRLRAAAGHRRQPLPGRRGRGDRRAQGRQRRRAPAADRQARAPARRARPGRGRRRARRDHAAAVAAVAATCRNLLALAIDAARAKATVGEISAAMEEVFGRYTAQIRTIGGVYSAEAGHDATVQEAQRLVEEFEEAEGRRPRILVAKMGQDGHDRGQKVIATAFADLGFDVDVGPLFQTPEEVARQAVEADVHVVGVSSLAAGHLTLVPALRAALDELGRRTS